jgi:hypothetical protein
VATADRSLPGVEPVPLIVALGLCQGAGSAVT